MNHRSLIFDLFGGYIRYDGGRIALRDLAALAEPFGVSPDALRVVMSRLRREGWFEATRTGGTAHYEATAKTWQLVDEGFQRIFPEIAEPWHNEWYVVIYEVPEAERGARDQLRKQLAWLGFGPLAAATWLSPHDRLVAVRRWAEQQPAVRVETLVARSLSAEQDQRYASRCWDLDEIALDYLRFLERFDRPPEGGWAAMTGSSALVERVRLAHAYRLLLFRDPQLPEHLLPADWPGPRAAALFGAAYLQLQDAAELAYRAIVESVPPTLVPAAETFD